MLRPRSHAAWETSWEVTHYKITPQLARLTVMFLGVGSKKRRCTFGDIRSQFNPFKLHSGSVITCHTLFRCTWLFDYGVNCKGHDQEQALTFASLPPPHGYNPGDGCEKILFKSEIRIKWTITKSKSVFASLFVAPNTSEKATPFHPFIQSPLSEVLDETFYMGYTLMINVYPLNINPRSPLT